MKPRQIYYRRKKDKIIIEGKENGKTIYYKSLPHPEIMLKILEEAGKFVLKRKQCKDCKKPFRNLKKGLCVNCYKKWREKVENPEYQKIYGVEKRHNISYKKYEEITKVCVVCGDTSVIHLHHLDMNKKNTNEENLIGLCSKHHQLIHSEKDGKGIKDILEKKGFKKVFFGGRKKYQNRQNEEKKINRLDLKPQK